MLPNQAQAQAQALVGFEIFVQHNKLSAMNSVATVVFINFLLLNLLNNISVFNI
jgi:hypothetical protein